MVVTADHGISFQVKDSPAEPYKVGQIGWRRDLTLHNAEDVAFVPLFVKQPAQRDGHVDDSWVRSIDILPAILAKAHGGRKPHAAIGQALADRRVRPTRLPVVTNRHGSIELDPAALERRRDSTVRQRAARFGVGSDVDRLFRIGPNASLIGRSVTSFPAARGPAAPLRARFWGARRFVAVDLGGDRVPANVIGWLDGRGAAGRDLAVAVSGSRRSAAASPMGSLGLGFSLMVPESAFRDGFNATTARRTSASPLGSIGWGCLVGDLLAAPVNRNTTFESWSMAQVGRRRSMFGRAMTTRPRSPRTTPPARSSPRPKGSRPDHAARPADA